LQDWTFWRGKPERQPSQNHPLKTITRFPHQFTETEDCWISMPDGVRLAAKLWLPDNAGTERVPTIIEVLPYRKRDIYAPRDAMHHRYFAGHGYACMRVDIRGSGDSDGNQGVFAMRQEQDDTLEVLKWIAAQPWSDGQVAMFGISWGGFQAIQTAYRAPKELKAVMACAFAPDRYVYSQVYRGGSMLLRSIRWSTQLFGYKSRPPDPQIVGERWRAMWLERLENNAPQIVSALQHQNYGEYWRSRAIEFARIRCPFYGVSGWADGSYVSAVGEALTKLHVPRKGLIGPWGHRFPHLGMPGPAVGFLQQTLRWFNHWLRGKETGIMEEPMLMAWMPRAVPAKNYYPESPGRWVAEPQWPSPRMRTAHYVMSKGGRLLPGRRSARAVIVARTPQTLGLDCGELMPWFQHGPSPELPGDQRADDGKSICFDTEPLAKTIEILGTPVAELTLSVDRPVAFVCVRLCDVAPDGASTRVTYGVFNLTHIRSREKPAKIAPGRRYPVRVPLSDAAYSFAPGHRIRVAVSTTYWPLLWPSPEPVTLTLHAGMSTLALPVRPPRKEDAKVRFKPVEAAAPFKRTVLEPGGRNRVVHSDQGKNETIVEVTDYSGRNRYDEIDLVAEARSTERYRLVEGDPLSCTAEVTWTWIFERGDWKIRTESRQQVTCTKRDFLVTARLGAYEGDRRVFERHFEQRIARNGN
jgi:uncharacterized protein